MERFKIVTAYLITEARGRLSSRMRPGTAKGQSALEASGEGCGWCWDECSEYQGQRVVAAWKACAAYCKENSLEEMVAHASVKGCQIGGGIAKQATHWLEELHAAEDPFERGRKVGELIGEIGRR